jgi:hypothetical protein
VIVPAGQIGRATRPVRNSVYCSSYSAPRSQATAVSSNPAASSAASTDLRHTAPFTER